SLATTTGMHLGLDHPHIAADFVTCRCGLFRGVYGIALGYGQAVFSEQLLTLIFMEIHACLPFVFGYCAYGAALLTPRHLWPPFDGPAHFPSGENPRAVNRGSLHRGRRATVAPPATCLAFLAVGDMDRLAVYRQ